MGKLQRQILDLNEFQEWIATKSTMYAKCSVSDKELRITFNGGFQIFHKGEKVFECMQPYTAIEKYNEL
jgi:hypothetical protein